MTARETLRLEIRNSVLAADIGADPALATAVSHIAMEKFEAATPPLVVPDVDLLDVHESWQAEFEYGPVDCCPSPWAQHGAWHLVVGRPRPLPEPIPARGMLGLWTPAADVLEQLQVVADA